MTAPTPSFLSTSTRPSTSSLPGARWPGARPAQRAGTLTDGHSRLRSRGHEIKQFLGLGTFSQFLVTGQHAVVPIPKDIPFSSAALLGCAVLTGIGAATRTAPVRPGDTVVVVGCGGVGVNVIQGARIGGAAQIVGVDPLAEKREFAHRLGATHIATPDELATILLSVTEGRGADIVYDIVGSTATVRASLDSVRRGGQLCIVGSQRDASLELSVVMDLILGSKRISGCCYGSSSIVRDIPRAVAAYRSGALELDSLVTHRLGLEQINEAFDLIAGGDGIRTVIEFSHVS